MHLCCLGVMKKLFEYWLEESKHKLSYRQRVLLRKWSENMSTQISFEYQRKTKSLLKFFRKLKATEFRSILLYSRLVILQKLLPKHFYKNFLLFHAACRLLCSEEYAYRYCADEKTYFQKFVSMSRRLYDKILQTKNMHNLIHLAEDVRNMECNLSYLTCFSFDNVLGRLKKQMRSGIHVLAQAARRLFEKHFLATKKPGIPAIIEIVKEKI